MFVYAHWDRNGRHVFQAFHKEDKAVDFTITHINGYIQSEIRNSYASISLPNELTILKDYVDMLMKDKISHKKLPHAIKAIELYEEYIKYVLGFDSPLHTIQDLKVVE